MPKKKSRYSDPKPLPPDDPIYQEGFTVFTPLWARPGFKMPELRQKLDDKSSEKDEKSED